MDEEPENIEPQQPEVPCHPQPPRQQNGLDRLKLQVESYHRIGDRAHDRFARRNNTEWKFTIAFWTLFAVGTGFVLTVDMSPLTRFWAVTLAVATLLVVCLLLVLFWWWLHYMTETDEYDRMVSISCEQSIRKALRLEWNASEPEIRKPGEVVKRLREVLRQHLHLNVHFASRLNFLVAVSLAALFLAAFNAKLWSPRPKAAERDVQIESLEIDGNAKLKLQAR